MVLYIPGTADPQHVLTGQRFSSKTNYFALGEMPLKMLQMVTEQV